MSFNIVMIIPKYILWVAIFLVLKHYRDIYLYCMGYNFNLQSTNLNFTFIFFLKTMEIYILGTYDHPPLEYPSFIVKLSFNKN
jgi:hypothetical protein